MISVSTAPAAQEALEPHYWNAAEHNPAQSPDRVSVTALSPIIVKIDPEMDQRGEMS
jgi:hypothetical protein